MAFSGSHYCPLLAISFSLRVAPAVACHGLNVGIVVVALEHGVLLQARWASTAMSA